MPRGRRAGRYAHQLSALFRFAQLDCQTAQAVPSAFPVTAHPFGGGRTGSLLGGNGHDISSNVRSSAAKARGPLPAGRLRQSRRT